MRIQYVHHFSHVAHSEINCAFEHMHDNEMDKAIESLNKLKKFINETIRDCKEARMDDDIPIDHHINGNCRSDCDS